MSIAVSWKYKMKTRQTGSALTQHALIVTLTERSSSETASMVYPKP